MLIAVPILIDSVERRRAIRESWGNFSSYPSCEIDLTLKFFVGNPRNENEKTILGWFKYLIDIIRAMIQTFPRNFMIWNNDFQLLPERTRTQNVNYEL